MSTISKENQDEENSNTDKLNKDHSNDEMINDEQDQSNGSSLKKKIGKFRILNDNQSPTHDMNSMDQLDHKIDDSDALINQDEQQIKSNTESFVPPTLLNQQSNSDQIKEDLNNNCEDKDKPKKGKPGRKKGFKIKKVNLDENDDSHSPLRRRSSRLKVLEEKKESVPSVNNDELNNEDSTLNEIKNDENTVKDNPTSSLNLNEAPAAATTITTNNEKDDQQQQQQTTSKDKKKDKKRKDKKKSKKHDKRKSRRRESNTMKESSDENQMDSDNLDRSNSNDCFTPPSSLAASLNNDNLKPEKVKSRWRRNSELESGHNENELITNKKDALSSSENLIHNNIDNNTTGTYLTSPINSLSTDQNENTEPMPNFNVISDNIYLVEKKITKFTKEVKKMVCDCILTKEERLKGIMGCGEDCLNRMLMIECGSKCPLENHCTNKRFIKRQYSKVEAFKTARKGWGLRALQPLQPGQFIMEYVGEVIGPSDFRSRVKKYSKEGHEHHFFMALKADEIIDATTKGNITRFVNHSCSPNAETQKWTVNGDLRIGFFSSKYIQPGEEITFDYQFQRYGKEAQRCYCESENCRGFIGATDVSNEVDISIEDESKSSVKSKPKEPTDKLKEEFEDLALEEEIDKLKEFGCLKNRHQTLMLARLMVRAEETHNRLKLLQVIRNTKENACLRLLVDYHCLQLLWSWMVDLNDVFLKAEIINVLEILPIQNKTMLKDSKVYDVIERWSMEKNEIESKSADKYVDNSKDSKSVSGESPNEDKKLTNGDLLNELKQENESIPVDKKEELIVSEPNSSLPAITNTTTDQKSSLLKGFNIIKKDVKSTQEQQQQKSIPNICLMSTRLLNLWKDLKEVFRIPRLERQKRHEDEKEADRKALENENEINKLNSNNTAAFLRRNLKRPLDQKYGNNYGYNNYKQPYNAQQQTNNNEQFSTANKISKEEHRASYNLELMRKDYEEAMKQYKKQCEQYNATIQQQLTNLSGAVLIAPIQPPLPPAPPNIYQAQHQLNQSSIAQSPSFQQYNNLFNNAEKQLPNEFRDQHTPVYANNNLSTEQYYTQETDYQSNYSTQQELVSYNHLYNYYQQPSTDKDVNKVEVYADTVSSTNNEICAQNESLQNQLNKSWNTIFNELTSGKGKNTIECTNDEHSFLENDLQADYHFDSEEKVSKLDSIYPTPGTYWTTDDKTYFIPSYSNGDQQNLVECNFELPSKELSKRSLPKNWKYSKDKNGYFYYYNKDTNQVQWNVPSDEKVLQNKRNSEKENDNIIKLDSKFFLNIDVNSIDSSKIDLAKITEIINTTNGFSAANITSTNGEFIDSKKRIKVSNDEDSQDQLSNNLSMELENKIIKFPHQQQKQKRKYVSKHKIKEKFKTDLSEHIKSLLNPYRRDDCKIGKILCDGDFKYLARKLTHEIFGKESKRCKSTENLVLGHSVKQKTKDYVTKYLSKFGPFFKPPEDRGATSDEDEESEERIGIKRKIMSSPVLHHQTASNSASNSLDTTPRVDLSPKNEHLTPKESPLNNENIVKNNELTDNVMSNEMDNDIDKINNIEEKMCEIDRLDAEMDEIEKQ